MSERRPKEVNRTAHLQRVYQDAEFADEVAKLRRELEVKYGVGVSFQVADAGIFVYAQTGLPYVKEKTDRQKVVKLAKDWLISVEELVVFADYSDRRNKPPKNNKLKITIYNGKPVIELGKFTTLKDVVAAWPAAVVAQRLIYKAKPRQRSLDLANGYDLIHAITKVRKRNDRPTMLQIFWMYQRDELPGYQVRVKRFKSVAALERFYNRYKPKP